MKYIAALSAFCAIALSTPLPVFASNLSDITGPNVSDITGPNVSDITGPNASDITGSTVSEQTRNRAKNALNAGYDQDGISKLAEDLGVAYAECAGGGDCSTFNRLVEISSGILGE